jgi:hypothetical protein
LIDARGTRTSNKRLISLSAVEIRLERRSQLFCALTLVEETTSTLSSGCLSTVSTASVAVVTVCLTEYTKLLVVDDSRVVCIDHDNFEELVLSIFANPV